MVIITTNTTALETHTYRGGKLYYLYDVLHINNSIILNLKEQYSEDEVTACIIESVVGMARIVHICNTLQNKK